MSSFGSDQVVEAPVEFGILGQLEVLVGDEPLALGAHKQRALLALLLVNANEVVSTDRILDELWGDESAGKQNALWVHVSNLRTALEPDRAPRTESTVLLSRSPGYVLRAEPDQIDAHRFESLVAEGRSLLATDPEAASLVFGEALALWRGKALEDFTYEEFAQREIARLDEFRLEAVEERIEADLRSGRGPGLVGELEALVREHPLRERLTGQLMVALYRAGRQAEALRAYQQLASRLGESLGIEPSRDLQGLEEQILLQDQELTAVALVTEAGPAPGLAVRGYELREEIGRGSFGVAYRTFQPAVGREVAIKVIRPELANDADFIRRFETEAKLVAGLEHPHIVPLYDYWREPDAAFLVMRLMKGGSLEGLMDQGPLSEEGAVQIVGQVAEALAAAHHQGIVHRDIKPSNILLDQEGNAFLADFGIAAATAGGPEDLGQVTPQPPYASPEYLSRRPASVRSDIYSLGMVLRESLTGPADDPPASLVEVVERATAVSPAERYPDVEAFAADLVRAAGGEIAETVPTLSLDNPYKGLRAFEEGDAETFFGRERLVERLVSRLGAPGGDGRFVVLVGPSGSGKSSAVKAGLLPALRRGAVPDSDSWFVTDMVPGRHPFQELETALLRVAVDPPPTLLEQLEADPRGLRRVVGGILPDDHSQLLLVIDQLEELFTQTESEETRKQFLDALQVAATGNPGRLRVVATLRADFYDRPLRYHEFGELLRAGTEVITPMSPSELERAVAGPAESVRAALETGLAATVVSDVADQGSALPLLQYAMTELFERREGATLTAEAYQDLGGVAGALGRRAEDLYQLLDDSAAVAARQVFLRLVTLGEGEEDTRRRVLRSELRALVERPEAVDEVLDVYGRHRLLTFDRDPVSRGPTVELAHEALLREWPRYRGWVDDARADLRFQRRLGSAAAEWQQNDEDADYLLVGSRLAEAEAWLAATDLALVDVETRYVAESSEQASELHQAQRRRRRIIGGVLGAVGALALAFLVFAFTQRSAADRLAEVERINRIIESAEDSLVFDPELSLLLATVAADDTQELGLEVFPENLEVLHEGLVGHRLLFTIPDVNSMVFSPDGSRVYVGLEDGSVSVRDSTTAEEIASTPAGTTGTVEATPLAISADGRWLASAYSVIDTGDLEIAEPLWPQGHFVGVVDVESSPDGRLVAAVDVLGQSTAVWDRSLGQEVWTYQGGEPRNVAFSTDGTQLALSEHFLTDIGASVALFDALTGDQVYEPIAVPGNLFGVAFHPDGSRLLIGVPFEILHWDLELGEFVRTDAGHGQTVLDIDFSADGALIAAGDFGGELIVRDGESGEPLYPLPRHEALVESIDLSGDGTRLASVSGEGLLRVFDTSVEGGRDMTTIDTRAGLPWGTVDVDPSGSLVALGTLENRQVWDLTGAKRYDLPMHVPHEFQNVAILNGPIAFSGDGRLATGDASGEIRIWDSASGGLLMSSHVRDIAPSMGENAGDHVLGLEYSPDGQQLAVGGEGYVMVVNAATMNDAVVLRSTMANSAEEVSFSPDGTRLVASSNFTRFETPNFPVTTWNVSSGEVVNHMEFDDPVWTVDYSPRGDLIAIGRETEVTLYDAETFELRHTLRAASRGVGDVDFSRDGRLIVVAHGGEGILVWDAESGSLLYGLTGHADLISRMDWTDDGTRLVSIGFDGTIRVYAMDTNELLDLARDRVTRTLTDQECRQHLGQEGC